MMASAEFRCHREALGVPVEWLAWHMSVTPRSVHRWEADETHPIPECFADMLWELVAATDRYVQALTRKTETVPVIGTYRSSADIPRVGGGERVIFPASWHRAATLRAARHHGAMIYYRDADHSTIDDAAQWAITQGWVAH